ncbi:MAG TPA: ACP S-malonyltransferase [Saprospiraceae bacterium]|nr:ACP S-malonyltransferase [Saprospiraceae bacterium]MCC6688149.1 ACP S-malonyltransferase [Saprospiraceae bacterium]HMV24746.1 ACP S-malonyltransferase [Saprospiraceae bacterium]HMX81968.1 ACP S-malonyltransferase [Saprospiraceae bacterium]HMX85256.1 ACP S-malonyltransferase [Saprospiraceae bacterium]
MRAFVFPGQASQFVGMGKDMYTNNESARILFDQADEILGYQISKVMFEGTEEELKETRITQPSVFLHSVIKALINPDVVPDMVAGHSLGEFSALVVNGCLDFASGLLLVKERAEAMQQACELEQSTMAAILGLEDNKVEEICNSINHTVIAANYNCPGQLVISGSIQGVEEAMKACMEAGAKRAIKLAVGGAFHSPFMQPAQDRLKAAIEQTQFSEPFCPVYQNVNATPSTDPDVIKKNILIQLTAPVLWTQIVRNMITDGCDHFTEVGGSGSVLRGMIRQIDRNILSDAL